MSLSKTAIKILLESKAKDDALILELAEAMHAKTKDPENVIQYALHMLEQDASKCFDKDMKAALERLIGLLPNFNEWEISSARNISTIIHRLGKLARRGITINAKTYEMILRFIDKLTRRHPNSQEIANTVWGLGKLAEAGICPELSGDAREGLNSLVKDLCRARPKSQAYCKYRLGPW